ncbi:TetR/AcrR family transcriptional regulator [Clostridium chauvoei]|nr:TetR/AcrR family transcriptional regulator [Clostridium chauvoei]MBX7362623.1 TetR/AcrR family transcriptional regulator [Clostridium chauvoei]
MPKVIENLQEKIFDAAIKLFGEKGYENVDMKAIAKESNIAVGTLYNYYSNKRGLYIKVLESSWEGTFNKLQKIVISDLSDREKINKIVEYLYYDI